MKIATWNVNGIRARQNEVASWIGDTQPDVVCLQEIKATCAQVPAGLCEIEGYWCYWHGGERGYSGVAMLVSKQFSPEEPHFAHPEFDFESRIVLAKIGPRIVASIYVPNGGKDFPAKIRFLDALEASTQAFARDRAELILCGDLNIARAEIDVHPKLRDPRVTGQLPQERAQFERLLGHGLVDVGRALDPENDGLFTWWAAWRNMRERNIGWRLDYVLASPSLAARASSCVVEAKVGTSDHAPVVATFAE